MEKKFNESVKNCFETIKIDKEKSVICGICAFRPLSLNGRVYQEKAINSLTRLMEGCKSFRNHGGLDGQSVETLLGDLNNIRRRDNAIFGDFSVLENAEYKDLVFDIAENKPNLAGFSISAQGKFADETDANGYEVVEDVLQLYSVDFVGQPATTSGMFENKDIETRNDKLQAELDELKTRYVMFDHYQKFYRKNCKDFEDKDVKKDFEELSPEEQEAEMEKARKISRRIDQEYGYRN